MFEAEVKMPLKQYDDLKEKILLLENALKDAKELFMHYHETYCGSEYCDEGCQVTECKFREIGTRLMKV